MTNQAATAADDSDRMRKVFESKAAGVRFLLLLTTMTLLLLLLLFLLKSSLSLVKVDVDVMVSMLFFLRMKREWPSLRTT